MERAMGTDGGSETALIMQPVKVPCSLAQPAVLQVSEGKFNVQHYEYHNSKPLSNSSLLTPLPQGSSMQV